MFLRIHPERPNQKDLQQVAECLRFGGVIIYPTDTVYAIGCDVFNSKAVERVCRIKNIKPEKSNFSFVFYDLSQLSDFTRTVDTPTYKILRKALPGPFTFILEANNRVPKLFRSNKKTVGIRIPDNAICRGIVKELGNPIISTSVHDDDEILDYTTDPDLINERFKSKADIIIGGGFSNNMPSTVVDFTSGHPVVLRQGLGVIEGYE